MLKSILDKLLYGEGKLWATLANSGQNSLGQWGSKENPIVDPNVQASVAGVFTPTYPITRVSGVLAITGITVPYADFSGSIILIPTGLWTWTAAGNIAVAGSAVVSRAVQFTYDPFAAKWYPSYV